MGEDCSVTCVSFLVGGTGACVLVGGVDLVLLVGRATSSGVFWGVCELIMTLGCLSANGWDYVPVLLVVWHRAFITGACWPLGGTGS